MNKQHLLKRLSEMTAKQPEVTYTGFSNGVLSNWHPAEIIVDGEKFWCSDQYVMACKAELFGDNRRRDLIMMSREPQRIIEIGREVSNFDQKIWDEKSVLFMFEANVLKYSQNLHMAKTLIDSNEILVYCNEADLKWGAGIHMRDPRLASPFEWPGENDLGFTLMEVREVVAALIQEMPSPIH